VIFGPLIDQATGQWALLRTTSAGAGVVTLATTNETPNSFVSLNQPNGVPAKVATVLNGGAHTLATL